MKYYTRADGTRAQAIQFKGREEHAEEALWIITILNDHGMFTNWVAEAELDEWFENEEGEPEQVIIPEHLKIVREFGMTDDGDRIELGVDRANVGDYIVDRDGEYYVMAQELFESIYEEVKI